MNEEQQDTSTHPFCPGNSWVMATALQDGLTCRVRAKHIANILSALEYHKISAVIEQEDAEFVLVIPRIP